MTLEEILIKLSEKHEKIIGGGYSDLLVFDQNKKNIKSGSLFLVQRGKIIPQLLMLENGDTYAITETMKWIQPISGDAYHYITELFRKFKKSRPDRYSDMLRSNFYAYPLEMLSIHDVAFAEKRQTACYRLELTLMYLTNCRRIKWKNQNHWYWCSPDDKDLILYRNWF